MDKEIKDRNITIRIDGQFEERLGQMEKVTHLKKGEIARQALDAALRHVEATGAINFPFNFEDPLMRLSDATKARLAGVAALGDGWYEPADIIQLAVEAVVDHFEAIGKVSFPIKVVQADEKPASLIISGEGEDFQSALKNAIETLEPDSALVKAIAEELFKKYRTAEELTQEPEEPHE